MKLSAKDLLNGRVITAFIMLLIFSIMTTMAFGFPSKAKLMPLMFGIPGVILGLAQLIMEIKHVLGKHATQTGDVTEEAKLERKNELQMFLWVFLFFVFITSFGFVYSSPFLVFGFLYIAKSESLKIAIIGGVCTFAIVYGVFQTWFQIPLFEGLVLEWLFD
ncbi:MAG: hypothetical protein ACI9XC_001427 [Gammaproteobacteria bacterium]|jgi:hypothetical protein